MSDVASLARNPRFVRLWTARVVSRFGSALSYVVLLWLTFAETHSALAVAYVGVAGFVPTVALGLFSGALVDRFDRRRVIVLSTLGRGVAMGALVLSLEWLGFRLPVVLLASVVFSVCATFFGPGSQALLPELVPRASLADANGLFESTESMFGIAGNAAAGVLIVAVGATPSLGIDAVAYFVAALFIGLIAVSATSPGRTDRSEPLVRQVREGLSYLRHAVGLLELTVAALVLNFLFAFVLTFLVVYSTQLLHGGALVYAALEALLAAGWGAGGLLVGRFGLTRYTGRIQTYSAFAQGGVILALVAGPTVLVALPVFFVAGIMQGIVNVSWLSTVQAIVPERLQGRYFATDNMVSFAAIPAAQILGGVLIVVSGLPDTFLAAGIGSIATGAVLLRFRELQRVRYDARAPD